MALTNKKSCAEYAKEGLPPGKNTGRQPLLSEKPDDDLPL